MRRKPRSLFKARRRPDGKIYVGPQFVGPEPHYLPKVDDLIRTAAGAIRPGEVNHIAVRHDDWCGIWSGGPCDCDPDVGLMNNPPVVP